MSPSELLLHLEARDPLRDPAARALVALLEQLSRGRLVEPSSRQSFEVRSAPERDEVVARVALKVLECSPLPVAGKSDGECRRYLSTMLVRAHIAEYRKRARLVLTGDEKIAALSGQEPPQDDARTDAADAFVARARALLDRAFARVLAERQERFRPPLQQAYEQIVSLVFQQVSFNAILARDEGVDPVRDRAAFVRARNRVFKNHERLRVSLREAGEALTRDGSLQPHESDALRQAILLLFRCQNSPASRVVDSALSP
jgi:hypothetical protein